MSETCLPSRVRPEGALVRARTSFLVGDSVVVDDGSVRDIILASWTRSRESNIDARGGVSSRRFDTESDFDCSCGRLILCWTRNLTKLSLWASRERLAPDADGALLQRRTGDSSLSQALDRIWLAPGFSYSERFVGTNGIGTALEGRGPAEVFGHEHYVEPLAQFACAGAPRLAPGQRQAARRHRPHLLAPGCRTVHSTAVARIARQIETALMDQSGPRELALLHDYLTACRRSNMAVFAVSPDLVMSNDRARELIDPADQAGLIAGAIEAMNSERRVLLLDLPSGVVARVQVRPSWVDRGAAGGVLQVQLAAPEVPKPRAVSPAPVTALPAAVGSGLLWAKCCQAVDRHFHSREWLVLQGEAGTGKTTIARATHQLRTPAAHLRILNAEDYGPGWVADVAEELATGCGTLVLTHLDQLSDQARQELVDALEPYRESTEHDRAWLVATVGPGGLGRPDDPVDLLEFFPRTVVVPPLRHHVEDVAELVPHFIARLTRGAELSCSPEAMRLLMRNRWPGNIEQLYQVLRKTVARRRAGVLAPDDLPPEVRAITRRVLTPLEAIECDAIVDALLDNNGNKAEAARHLGMSRATIYRKIRGYGISTPTTG